MQNSESQNQRPLDPLIQQIIDGSEDFIPPAPTKVIAGDFRPRITLPGDGRLANDFCHELGSELAKGLKIFTRDGNVVVVHERTEALAGISAAEFVTWIEKFVVCQRFSGAGTNGRMVDCTMAKSVAEITLVSPAFLSMLPEVKRVNRVRLPVWRGVGRGVEMPRVELLPCGYDVETSTYTFPEVCFDEEMSAEKAFAVINELFQDVAFDPADGRRSHSGAVSMLLTPFCDQLLDDRSPRPAFIVGANCEGAGKTFLAKMALASVYGDVAITPPPARDKIQETLNAAVRDGKPYLFFDNWKGEISEASLEGFLSAGRWTGRVLGQPTFFDVPKRCLIFITGNDAKVGSDMRRRSILIALFVEDSQPENRKVSRPMEEKDILDRRPEILSALWAIVRYWRDACQFYPGKQNRSFGEWGDIVGGIVQCICSNQSPLDAPGVSYDERSAIMQAFVALVSRDRSDLLDVPLKFSQLRDVARESGLFTFLHEHADDLTPEQRRSEDSKLSKAFFDLYAGHHAYQGRKFNLDSRPVWFCHNGQRGRNKRYIIGTERWADNARQS
jgi:hypothetical protein